MRQMVRQKEENSVINGVINGVTKINGVKINGVAKG